MACQVPWGHYANVLAGIKDPAERLYYLRATAQFGWSQNVLLNQVKAGAHTRSLPKGKTHNQHREPGTEQAHLAHAPFRFIMDFPYHLPRGAVFLPDVETRKYRDALIIGGIGRAIGDLHLRGAGAPTRANA
jgi:hypothetical protein